jgi:hypothetical protein
MKTEVTNLPQDAPAAQNLRKKEKICRQLNDQDLKLNQSEKSIKISAWWRKALLLFPQR